MNNQLDDSILQTIIQMYGRMGVYSAQYGGVCEACGRDHVPVETSMKWQNGRRTRYHKCECGNTFKTIQYDLIPNSSYR